MSRAYKVAVACGTIPLVFGISLFLVWLITRQDILLGAGVFAAYGCLGIFAVGLLALVYFFWAGSRTPGVDRSHLRRKTIACGVLLFSNLPVGAAVGAATFALVTRYTVVVENATSVSLEDARVFGGGCDESFGSILPGERAQQSLWFKTDGVLVFTGRLQNTVYEETVEGYVTGAMGGHVTVTINPDGTITLSNDRA
jgi:hypothetical protein